jgi:hypothetical protein
MQPQQATALDAIAAAAAAAASAAPSVVAPAAAATAAATAQVSAQGISHFSNAPRWRGEAPKFLGTAEQLPAFEQGMMLYFSSNCVDPASPYALAACWSQASGPNAVRILADMLARRPTTFADLMAALRTTLMGGMTPAQQFGIVMRKLHYTNLPDFITQIQQAASHQPPMIRDIPILSTFYAHLPVQLREKVVMRRPMTLDEAIDVAQQLHGVDDGSVPGRAAPAATPKVSVVNEGVSSAAAAWDDETWRNREFFRGDDGARGRRGGRFTRGGRGGYRGGSRGGRGGNDRGARERQADRCKRCQGFGHWAEDCATPRPAQEN